MSWRASFQVSRISAKMVAVLSAYLMLTCFLAAGAAPSNEGGYHPAVPADVVARIPFKNQNRKYLVHLPPSYDGRKAMPLVVCLHGGGGDIGFAKRMFGLNEKADREGFVVAYPNGSGRLGDHILTWNSEGCCGYAKAKHIDDVAFMRDFLKQIKTDYNIDNTRVYLTGFSLGGMMVYKLASELADEISAVAIVGGSMHGNEKLPNRPMPVLIIHGLADRHVPVTGGGGKLAKWGFNVNAKPLNWAVDFWVTANGCSPEPKVEKQGIINRHVYANGKDGSEVVVVTIDGYRHSWPGGKRAWLLADTPCPDLSATDTAWEFFSRHQRSDMLAKHERTNPELSLTKSGS